jgi:hypothetical protein
LLGPVLSGSVIVSLATQPGPIAEQLLVDGAIADAVLALDGDRLVYVNRPDGLAKAAYRNLGGLSLARWEAPSAATVLAEGSEARAIFDTALDEVRVLRAATLVGLASEAVGIGLRQWRSHNQDVTTCARRYCRCWPADGASQRGPSRNRDSRGTPTEYARWLPSTPGVSG